MPNPISRIGDQNQEGGVIMRGASTILAEFQPVGFVGSTLSEHGPWDQYTHPPHISSVVTNGSVTILCEGQPPAMVGSMNSCGHSIIQGATTILVT